ncbi:hypothetical protein FPANT_4097 [Fusarium pseudoanthophilum]|uniref:Uncharacterized protein n=1 Tax=Fusarium pseudoanthophilum TaxID=48495 RepID=A0A8H5UU24_9HYPO|nr:hypothetical protein FPANT_4097 [Fusarium pseudoanthophilum]
MKATGMCSLKGLLDTLGNEIPSRECPSVVNVSVTREDYISELSGNGVNDERLGYPASRPFARTLSPVGFRPNVPPQNVTHIRICKAAEPETYAAEVPVVKNTTFTDVIKRKLQSLERPAGSEARGAGNFAAPVLHVIDIDEAEKVTASLWGLLVRVAAAVV